jgi:hypothetical protein
MSKGKELNDQIQKQIMWGDIHRRAETDSELQELLDRVVIYYRLKYEQRRRQS